MTRYSITEETSQNKTEKLLLCANLFETVLIPNFMSLKKYCHMKGQRLIKNIPMRIIYKATTG